MEIIHKAHGFEDATFIMNQILYNSQKNSDSYHTHAESTGKDLVPMGFFLGEQDMKGFDALRHTDLSWYRDCLSFIKMTVSVTDVYEAEKIKLYNMNRKMVSNATNDKFEVGPISIPCDHAWIYVFDYEDLIHFYEYLTKDCSFNDSISAANLVKFLEDLPYSELFMNV